MPKGFACKNSIDFAEMSLFKVTGGYVPHMTHTWRLGVLFKFHGYPDGQFPEVGESLWVIFSNESRVNYSKPWVAGTTHIHRLLGDETQIATGSTHHPYGYKYVIHIYRLKGLLRPNRRGNILRLFMIEHQCTSDDGAEGSFLGENVAMSVMGECRSATGKNGIRHYVGVVVDAEEPSISFGTN